MPNRLEAEHSVLETPLQDIILHRPPGSGLLLDVGGGGEGIVSRIEGPRVCAIDISLSEIREAQIYGSSPQWLACDGRALCFRSGAFDVVTIWFALDYMADWKTKHEVIREANRVLKPKGLLSVLSSRIVCPEEEYLLRMRYTLPDGTIYQTGYGVRGNQGQTMERVNKLIRAAGFALSKTDDKGYWFQIEGSKK
jgi:ubiquinone/menaquinone biosynthesis C-methylase UbiE